MTGEAHSDCQRMTHEELVAERDRLDEQLTSFWRHLSGWKLHLGPLVVRAAPGAQRLALGFFAFHVTLALGGALMIVLVQGVWADLGIAMVVGALFAFGSFLAQMWAMQQDRYRSFTDTDRLRRGFADLQDRYTDVANELDTRTKA